MKKYNSKTILDPRESIPHPQGFRVEKVDRRGRMLLVPGEGAGLLTIIDDRDSYTSLSREDRFHPAHLERALFAAQIAIVESWSSTVRAHPALQAPKYYQVAGLIEVWREPKKRAVLVRAHAERVLFWLQKISRHAPSAATFLTTSGGVFQMARVPWYG